MLGPQDVAAVPGVPHGRTARRLDWVHLPRQVRALVEERLGSPVVEARSQGSGFTPGFASRLTLADGSRAFVKAANKVAQRQIAEGYAEEARKLALLPPTLPMPRPRWTHQDDTWVVLAFDCVEGSPPQRPWQDDELAACLRTLEEVAGQLAAPPGGLADGLRLTPLHQDLPGLRTGWDHVRATRPDWPHLEEAAALAAGLPDLPDSGHVVHSDGRDDNFLLTDDGRALLCDWTWPALGPVWLDAVDLLVAAYGDGLDADAWLDRCTLTAGVPPDHLDTWLAAFTGFMVEAGDRPLVPSSPFLRVHARWYAAAAWGWLAERRGWS